MPRREDGKRGYQPPAGATQNSDRTRRFNNEDDGDDGRGEHGDAGKRDERSGYSERGSRDDRRRDDVVGRGSSRRDDRYDYYGSDGGDRYGEARRTDRDRYGRGHGDRGGSSRDGGERTRRGDTRRDYSGRFGRETEHRYQGYHEATRRDYRDGLGRDNERSYRGDDTKRGRTGGRDGDGRRDGRRRDHGGRSGGFGRGGDRARPYDTARDQGGGFGRGSIRRNDSDGTGRSSQYEARRGYNSHSGSGRGYGSRHASSHPGRGHHAGSIEARGRGAGPRSTGKIEALTNVLLAAPTPNFKFYRYNVTAKDGNGCDIQSSSRRNQLLALGLFDKLLEDRSDREKESLNRRTFFGGAFFYTAGPFPGLEDLPCQLLDGTDTELDTTIVESVQCLSAPEVLVLDESQAKESFDQSISLDFRCAGCTQAFVDWSAIKLHCQYTGHSPFVNDKTTTPASRDCFLQYVNIALQKAMAERMARWGRHYIDPQSFTTPKSKRGQEMGVNIFQAYRVEFNIGIPTKDSAPALMLTVDLTAKVIRTKSLLHALCRGRDPSNSQMFEKDQNAAKRKWIGETVISKLDKSCYAVHDLVFDQSPDSMLVGSLNMSHTQYFQERKNYKLDFPSAKPMVAVMGRNKKIIHFPAEIVCANELDDELKTQLPQMTSFKPDLRNQAIEKIKRFLIPGAQKSKGMSGLLPALGIYLSDERLRVSAVVLPAPVFEAAGIRVDSSRSNWASQIARAKFRVEPKDVIILQVVVIHHKTIKWESPYRKIMEIVNGFEAKYRFPIKPFRVIRAEDDMERHWGIVETHFGSSQQLPPNVFVVDFTKPRTVVDVAYPVVKKMFAQGGYLSQFVNFKKNDHARPRDQRRSDSILGGVARQILTKAGVCIWWTEIPQALPLPAIFVGVDVYHASRRYDPQTRTRVGRPSVAAIVVRLVRDRKSQSTIECYSETFVRDAGQEYDLGPAMEQTLSNAMNHLKISNPASCVIWRDGVPDTAIANTASQELPPVRKVIGEKVPLAMIVCQKRISIKFLSADGGVARGLPVGTLVEGISDLKSPTFYLNGTSPPYSTPKPVRFLVAERDQGLKETSLSELTWQCCHEYPNWSGSIKVPAVTQLAHCLAEHAGNQPDSGRHTKHASFVNNLYFI